MAGRSLLADGVALLLPFPPLLAQWLPHAGPSTPVAVVTAVAVCRYGPRVAARLRWGRLLVTAWAAAVVWTLALALVDGWHRVWWSGCPVVRSTCTTCRGSARSR